MTYTTQLLKDFIPKISAPGISAMAHGLDLGGDPMDPVLEKVAENQVKKEAEGENFLFTMLDYLARPQRAVAGVIKDAIDGGSFHPLDRIGKALAGTEKDGIKEVIDVVAPGKWSNMKLPDWLGGKDVDPTKEIIGFMGDVMTDPLMALRLFTTMGKAARFGKQEATFLKELAAKEAATAHKSSIYEYLSKEADKYQKIVGVGQPTMGAIANMRSEHRALHLLWEKMVKNPKEFAEGLSSPQARDAFLNPRTRLQMAGIPEKALAGKTEDELQQIADSFLTHRASNQASKRFAEGEQALIAFQVPWLMRKLGIPDGKWSLIPKLDKQWGETVAGGMQKFMDRFWNTPVGARVIKPAIDKIFRSGTGSDVGDFVSLQATVHGRMDMRKLEGFMESLRESFHGQYSDEHFKVVQEYLMNPKNIAGDMRQIPEEFQGIPLRKIVQDMSDVLYQRAEIHNMTPGLKHKLIGGQFSAFQAHEGLLAATKERLGDTAEATLKEAGIRKSSVLKRMSTMRANKIEKALADNPLGIPKKGKRGLPPPKLSEERFWKATGGRSGAFEFKNWDEIYDDEMWKVVRVEQEKAAAWLGDLSQIKAPWETGYFPRVLTPEAKDLLRNIIGNPRVTYKGRPAADYLYGALKQRNLTDFDAATLNQMAHDGTLPYNFMEQVFESARKNLRGRDRDMWVKYMNTMDHARLMLYVEDPVQAVNQYLVKSAKAVTNQRAINDGIRLHLRPITDTSELHLGESYALLSEEGMRNFYGENWKDAIGEVAYKGYNQMMRSRKLVNSEGAGGLLTKLGDITDLALAKGYGLPLFAINDEVLAGMNKFHKLLDDPETWRPIFKLWNNVTNLWKSWTLFLFPSYHTRNFFSNFVQQYFADTLDFKDYYDAARVFKSSGLLSEGRVGKGGPFVKPSKSLDDLTITKGTWNNQPYTMHQAVEDFYAQDLPQSGLVGRELTQTARGEYWKVGITSESVGKRTRRYLSSESPPLKTGAYIANLSDNWHRFAHFIGQIKRGKSPYEAAMSVKKYFHDYGELGTVEKNLFRNVFPFYTWTRKNIPLQLEFLIKNPGKFANLQRTFELLQTDEAKNMDRTLLPGWVSENAGLPTRINKDTGNVEVSLLGSWLPQADLRSVASLHDVFRLASGALNPLIKLPLENYFNKSVFSEQPIRNYEGEPAEVPFLGMNLTKRATYNLRSIRLLNEIDKLTQAKRAGGELPLNTRIISALGVTPKTYAFDVERLKERRKYEVSTRKGILKRGLKAARKVDRAGQNKYIRAVKSVGGE